MDLKRIHSFEDFQKSFSELSFEEQSACISEVNLEQHRFIRILNQDKTLADKERYAFINKVLNELDRKEMYISLKLTNSLLMDKICELMAKELNGKPFNCYISYKDSLHKDYMISITYYSLVDKSTIYIYDPVPLPSFYDPLIKKIEEIEGVKLIQAWHEEHSY